MILRAAAAALAGVTGLYLLAWRVAVSLDEGADWSWEQSPAARP